MRRYFLFGIIFILGVGAGWILQGQHWDVLLTSYVPVLATLVAAFYGAKYAFQFQKDKEKEDSKRFNVINGNAAIFTLMRMICGLRDIQKQFIDPARDLPFRFIQMQPALSFTNDDLKLNIESLYFLLETDDRNLLAELVVEAGRYHTAMGAFNERSRIHREEVQPLLERAGIVQGGHYSHEQIEGAIGNRFYITMQQSTDETINLVDDAIISLKPFADRLRASLKKQYPSDTIIGFELTEYPTYQCSSVDSNKRVHSDAPKGGA